MSLKNVALFDNNHDLYRAMVADIYEAKEEVLLETYRFNSDDEGKRFLEALIDRVKKGVRVRVLVDAWGTKNGEKFLEPLAKSGAEVRFFKKIRITPNYGISNHIRNHRKLLIIDRALTYIGSSNISEYSLKWRELNIRMVDDISKLFARAFHYNFSIYRRYDLEKLKQKPIIVYKKNSIVQQIPSVFRQNIKSVYQNLIRRAKREIVIETPYFLPNSKLRKMLKRCAIKGIKVKLVFPLKSDVWLVDILRSKYLGQLHKAGIEIYYYKPNNLHAKCMFIDNNIYSVSSANFDFRSFRYQYEIALLGDDTKVNYLLTKHVEKTIEDCIPFDYEKWKRRSLLQKSLERVLMPLRFLM